MIRLERISEEPLLRPNPAHAWEAAAVFNTAAILDNGLVHLVYRATDITSNGSQGEYINSLGYAVSEDGIHFNRLVDPILRNDVPQELRGPEDPRIVKIGELYYMMYTGYGGRFPGDYRICLATSRNLIGWERHGVVLDESNKDASLFPEQIDGKFWMLHRRPPHIWLATSKDMRSWEEHRVLMEAVPDSSWESEKVGIAGPPIRTPAGWLLIYHGVSQDKVYSLGIALLDLQNPGRVVARQAEPILTPQLDWEVNGYVPNVVFSCGQIVLNDEIIVYYGGADTAIGAAKMKLNEVDKLLK
jgi:predicted GH43/DUF377 family glycosyl hydrolase